MPDETHLYSDTPCGWAAQMLNILPCAELPTELRQRISRVNQRYRNVRGTDLPSAQVVAVIVEQWQREQKESSDE